MNVTRDVVRDLLPAYLAGEASEDTRRLVEDFFRQDPEFEREARDADRFLAGLPGSPPIAAEAHAEMKAIRRTRRVLSLQRVLFALAITCSLNVVTLGFGFVFVNGKMHLVWLALPFQAQAVGVLAVLAAVFWAAYFVSRRRPPGRPF